jgi:hypothetical protein
MQRVGDKPLQIGDLVFLLDGSVVQFKPQFFRWVRKPSDQSRFLVPIFLNNGASNKIFDKWVILSAY